MNVVWGVVAGKTFLYDDGKIKTFFHDKRKTKHFLMKLASKNIFIQKNPLNVNIHYGPKICN